MTFSPSEIILGASVPMANGSTVTLSVSGHIENERDCDDAVVIFSRKLLKYTNSASDEDRLTVRQVVSSITSTPLDKVPDVGAPSSATPAPLPTPEPAKPAPQPATTAPAPKPAAPEGGVCEGCGAPVTKSQAKLSQMFMSKTLCKTCMDQTGGV
jgi:hypothetical protein